MGLAGSFSISRRVFFTGRMGWQRLLYSKNLRRNPGATAEIGFIWKSGLSTVPPMAKVTPMMPCPLPPVMMSPSNGMSPSAALSA